MADTIINTPPQAQDSGAAGWMVAVIILLAVIIGGFVLSRYYGIPRAAAPSPTNINVTIPNPIGGQGATGGTTKQ